MAILDESDQRDAEGAAEEQESAAEDEERVETPPAVEPPPPGPRPPADRNEDASPSDDSRGERQSPDNPGRSDGIRRGPGPPEDQLQRHGRRPAATGRRGRLNALSGTGCLHQTVILRFFVPLMTSRFSALGLQISILPAVDQIQQQRSCPAKLKSVSLTPPLRKRAIRNGSYFAACIVWCWPPVNFSLLFAFPGQITPPPRCLAPYSEHMTRSST